MDQDALFRHGIRQRTPKTLLTANHLSGAELLPNRLAMLDLIPKNGRCAEIGVANGGFSKEILARLNPRQLTLVDMWDGDRYGSGRQSIERLLEEPINSGLVALQQMRSVDWLSRNENHNSFDFIYIDTDHTYSTTLHELNAAQHCLRPGGLLAGHDYCVGNIVTPVVYGVIEAVNKFCIDSGWKFKYMTVEPEGWNSFCLTRIT